MQRQTKAVSFLSLGQHLISTVIAAEGKQCTFELLGNLNEANHDCAERHNLPSLSSGPFVSHPSNDSENSKKEYMCSYCNKMFRSQYNCARHQKVHTAPEIHACRVCKKEYNRKDNLLRHERSHDQPDETVPGLPSAHNIP